MHGFFCCASLLAIVVVGAAGLPAVAEAATPAAVLAEFSKTWPDERTPYRTEADTTSWQAYVLAMKQLVGMGDRAVPALVEACDDASFQVRALSARTLGFLQARQAVSKLIELLGDSQPPVALLAADALGQIQDPAGLKALAAARRTQRNGDVLLHVNKALQRGVPLESDVRGQIMRIDAASIDTARVGQPAPDFTLKDASGKPWSLADFRGKKAVVLVFIYGDG